MTPRPSPERLHELLYFDSEGELRWRERPPPTSKRWNTRYANKIAGCLRPDGYRVIRLNGKGWVAHHVVWAVVHGDWPAPNTTIDHRDRNRANNASDLSNLRVATFAENNWNRPAYRNNQSGFKGVSFDKRTGKWRAIIRCNKVVHRLGRYSRGCSERLQRGCTLAAWRICSHAEPELRRAA